MINLEESSHTVILSDKSLQPKQMFFQEEWILTTMAKDEINREKINQDKTFFRKKRLEIFQKKKNDRKKSEEIKTDIRKL